MSKLYLQVDLICQNRHLVSYRQVPGSIPGRGSFYFSPFFDLVPLLFHSNFQSWQMRSLPTLDPYVFFVIFLRTRYKGHGVFLLAFGPSGFRRYLIKSRAITVGKIPPAAKNICKMSGGRYPMHIKLPYNQPTSPPYTTQKFL